MSKKSLIKDLIDRNVTISYYKDLVSCYEAYLDTVGKPNSSIQIILKEHIDKLKTTLGYKTDDVSH